MNDSDYIQQMKKQMAERVDQLNIEDYQKSAIKERWQDQLMWLEGRSARAQKWYNGLRVTTVVGGVLIPALVGLSVDDDLQECMKWVVFSLGLVVAISASIESFFNFGERWRHYRRTAELLKSEGWRYFQLIEPYDAYGDHAKAYVPFTSQVEAIIQQDVDTFISVVSKPKKDTDGTGV